MRELTWTVVGEEERASTAGPRLGVLSVPGAGDGREEPARIATPACLTYTRRGEPAHLTPDVLATLPPAARAFQVSLVRVSAYLFIFGSSLDDVKEALALNAAAVGKPVCAHVIFCGGTKQR